MKICRYCRKSVGTLPHFTSLLAIRPCPGSWMRPLDATPCQRPVVPLPRLAGVLAAISLLLASCKDGKLNGVRAESASDGKAMLTGCIWILGGKSADDLALCDDGRACVRSGHDAWRCIQFIAPTLTCPACPTVDHRCGSLIRSGGVPPEGTPPL